jgi:two-component system sensor histidine kinase YesM
VSVVPAIRRLGIFPKLVLTFLITILPLYFISLQMNQTGAQSVKQEILNSMGTRVHFYLNSFEAELQRTLRLQKQFVVDDDLITLSTITPETGYYDFYETLLFQQRIQTKLMLMENSSMYIEQAKVYIPRIKKVFMSNSIRTDLSDAELKSFIPGVRMLNPLPALQYDDGRLLLRSIPPEISYLHKIPDFIIEAEISQFAVEQFLERMTYRDDEGVFLLDDKGRWQMDNNHDYAIVNELKAILQRQPYTEKPSGQLDVWVNQEKYMISYEHSPVLGAIMVVFVPERQILGPLQKYNHWLWGLSGISVFVVILFSYWIYRLIHHPLKTLVLALRKMEKGDLTISIRRRAEDEFHYLYHQFNSMVLRIKELIQESYESRIVAQRLELKQLQSQINPHFLYNTYFMIHRMAESGDLDNVKTATRFLGQYFMYITRDSSDEVSLEAEISHALNYAEIQNLRFSRRIQTVTSDIPASCSVIQVPRLILQPLLENAYQHGLKSKMNEGIVSFTVTEREDHILIVVEDNGDEFGEAELDRIQRSLKASKLIKETTGLVNVHLRLQLRFGESYGLLVSHGSLGGMRVDIMIPIHTEER